MVVEHTLINASVPEGEGLNLTINVVVANQTGYSLDYFVNYEAPVVSEIRPYDEIVGLPPSGCKTFEDNNERDQNSIGLRCLERAMITIVGENFGRPKRAKLIFTDALSVVRSGKILNSSHTIIQAVLEPGVGLTNITVSLPRNIRNAYEQVSSHLVLRLANLFYMAWYLDRRLRWQQYQIHLMPRVVISREILDCFFLGNILEKLPLRFKYT